MAICGVLCGADSWQEIADYSESKLDWLSTFLGLPGGIPTAYAPILHWKC